MSAKAFIDSNVLVYLFDSRTPLKQQRAAERLIKDQLSFWDALIIEAALESDCTILYREDFQDGRSYGTLTVTNPFH